MLKKTGLIFLRLALTWLAMFIFICCVGYYGLIFNWHITGTGIAVNAVIIIVAISASVVIYGVAEKMKKVISPFT